MNKEFTDYISESERVFITSHAFPDADAICSALLLGLTVEKNYPDKTVEISIEADSIPGNLKHLAGVDKIKTGVFKDSFEAFNPDLFILTDANNYDRATRVGAEPVRALIAKNKIRTMIIDHHQQDGKDQSDFFYHDNSPAATQDIFELCEKAGYEMPDGYADIAMTGLISDTGGFKYENLKYDETAKMVSKLLKAGVQIDVLTNKLEQYTMSQMKIITDLGSNLAVDNMGFNYSFVSDDVSDQWLKDRRSATEYKGASSVFVDAFIRNVEGNDWGFVVNRDLSIKVKTYSISFRSVSGSRDVQKIAKHFGGGGHIPAAGCKIEADSAEEAVRLVLDYIHSLG